MTDRITNEMVYELNAFYWWVAKRYGASIDQDAHRLVDELTDAERAEALDAYARYSERIA